MIIGIQCEWTDSYCLIPWDDVKQIEAVQEPGTESHDIVHTKSKNKYRTLYPTWTSSIVTVDKHGTLKLT